MSDTEYEVLTSRKDITLVLQPMWY